MLGPLLDPIGPFKGTHANLSVISCYLILAILELVLLCANQNYQDS